MTTYRAVVCSKIGAEADVALQMLPRVPLPAGSVRVRVEAAGVNFPDVLMLQGRYQFKPPVPFVAGMECAGRVIEASGAGRFAVGDAVIVANKTGAFAEEIVVPAGALQPLPHGMTMVEGAGFGVAMITAYHALQTRAQLKRGQTVLVLGAAGGVGAATVQVAKALGARVIAAASSAEKLAFAQALGADDLVDYKAAVLEAEVARVTAGRGADVVVDPVGWAPESASRATAFGGQILIAGFAGGTIPNYPANRLLLKSQSLVGVRAGQAARNDPPMREREWAELSALAARADLKPRVSQTFALSEFRSALAMLAERKALGRIVLTCA